LLLGEPFRWLFMYLFQPTTFRSNFTGGFLRRVSVMLRFLVPIFLCIYPIALAVRLLLPPFVSDLYVYSLARGGLLRLLIDTAWGTAVGMAGGILGAMALTLSTGITLCISIGLLGGSLVDTSTGPVGAVSVAVEASIVYGVTFGLLFGLTVADLSIRQRRGSTAILLGSIVGCLLGAVVGMGVGFLGGILLGRLPGIAGRDTTQSTTGGVIGAILGVGAMVVISSVISGLARRSSANVLRAIVIGRAIGIAFSLLMGLSGGVIGLLASSRNILATGLQYNEYIGLIIVSASSGIFLFCYLISYFRLPLYPISALSSLKAYVASFRNPAGVFHYLHHCSLYWDERVFLPLPRLEETLLIAAEQDVERTLAEISFILAERPQQILEARRALLAMALEDLEQRKTLSEIGRAEVRLYEIVPAQARQGDMLWVRSLAGLGDASRSAALVLSPASNQVRQEALGKMVVDLTNIHSDISFESVHLNRRLRAVIRHWITVAQMEAGRLQAVGALQNTLENPYVDGPPLQVDASSFVGRRDLSRQLELTLNRGVNRPTFFLTGERRTGKTSTLHNLPRMLGARYIPLFFDLESPGMSADAAAFLSEIAGAIALALEVRGHRVRLLEYDVLQQVSRTNIAHAYRLFDLWFKELDRLLTRRDLTLLLTFDEFEHLETAHAHNFLNLNLLLDWFRSVIQNRPRLALLFSGLHRPGEMKFDWAGHLVNVQTLKVGFLQPDEACRLILHPTPNYQSEQVYGPGVPEEIMRVTGCHPFLVQALCSALIQRLEQKGRTQAMVDDVPDAARQMLKHWWDGYFLDLWNRTSHEQRLCLFALLRGECVALSALAWQCRLTEQQVYAALETLLERDLVFEEEAGYRISTPIFRAWVQRWFMIAEIPPEQQT